VKYAHPHISALVSVKRSFNLDDSVTNDVVDIVPDLSFLVLWDIQRWNALKQQLRSPDVDVYFRQIYDTALKDTIESADNILTQQTKTVMSKKRIAPSGNKHDFVRAQISCFINAILILVISFQELFIDQRKMVRCIQMFLVMPMIR